MGGGARRDINSGVDEREEGEDLRIKREEKKKVLSEAQMKENRTVVVSRWDIKQGGAEDNAMYQAPSRGVPPRRRTSHAQTKQSSC